MPGAALVFLLVLCITRIDPDSALGTLLLRCSIISGYLYIVVSLTTLIVFSQRRKRLRRTDAFTDFVACEYAALKVLKTINFFRLLAFWGTLMTYFNVFVLHVSGEMILGGPYSTDPFLAMYHGFLLWSILALIVTFPLTLLFCIIYLPRKGQGIRSFLWCMVDVIWSDVAIPVAIIKSLFMRNKNGYEKKSKQFRLVVMVLFIAINVIAILKSM